MEVGLGPLNLSRRRCVPLGQFAEPPRSREWDAVVRCAPTARVTEIAVSEPSLDAAAGHRSRRLHYLSKTQADSRGLQRRGKGNELQFNSLPPLTSWPKVVHRRELRKTAGSGSIPAASTIQFGKAELNGALA